MLPPIMAAPNPTTKRQLKLTKCTHAKSTQNNLPGSVPLITNIAQRSVDLHPIPTRATATRWSPRTHTPSAQFAPTSIPRVRFSPVPTGGLRSRPIISQEAINFLTECVWAHSPDIFTSDKLHLATSPSCLNFKQLAMLMVYPTTGETIRSYKKLMHDPATAETWQTAFGQDFGSIAQGDNKTGQTGTNSIFVMSHKEIKKILTNQTITYACVVVNFRPQKADPHQICITAGGNLINYPSKLSTQTANLTTSKLMWNSILSTNGAKYLCLDIKNF
jgi:hypothetical protein